MPIVLQYEAARNVFLDKRNPCPTTFVAYVADRTGKVYTQVRVAAPHRTHAYDVAVAVVERDYPDGDHVHHVEQPKGAVGLQAAVADARVKSSPEETAARAAYRLGMLDAMLHPDVIDALAPPGVFIGNMRGEREARIAELNESGISLDAFKDLSLGETS